MEFLFFHTIHDTPKHLGTHLFAMGSSLHECEEVIFEKYLKLRIFDRIDSRIAWLIGDKCDFPEE